MDYIIRMVKQEDLEALADIEAVCFPEAEAADIESLRARIHAFPDSFFVAEMRADENKNVLIGFINGCVTDDKVICDEMFEDTSLHRLDGAYQSVFGLDVLPDYQRQGIAAALMKYLIGAALKRNRKGVILTCKEALIPYYAKFGYQNLGRSKSEHGGAIWYDMILEF